MGYIKSVVEQIHEGFSQVIKKGDVCIDGTCGNGYDTAEMVRLVGETGHVFAFDIQPAAIGQTKNRLRELGARTTLILDGHENIHQHIKKKIKVAVFNLGYLPNGDHSITTKGDTTLRGIQDAMALLEIGGIVFIALYWGHPQGREEKERLLSFIHSLDKKIWAVQETHFPNREMAPYLIAIEKKCV